jgi:hypothetical protein
MSTQQQFIAIGMDLAAKFFTKRSRSGARNVEVHLDESELAALLALAAEQGAQNENRRLATRFDAAVKAAGVAADLHVGRPPDTAIRGG